MLKAIQLSEDFVLFTAEQEATKVWRWFNLNFSSILSSNTRCLFQSFQFFKPSLLCGREEPICEDFFQALNTPLGKVDVIYHFFIHTLIFFLLSVAVENSFGLGSLGKEHSFTTLRAAKQRSQSTSPSLSSPSRNLLVLVTVFLIAMLWDGQKWTKFIQNRRRNLSWSE